MTDLSAVLSQLQAATRVAQTASAQDASLLRPGAGGASPSGAASPLSAAPALFPSFSAPGLLNPRTGPGPLSPDAQPRGELLRPLVDRPLEVITGERVTMSQGGRAVGVGGARKVQSSAEVPTLSVKPPPRPGELQVVFTGRQPDLSKAADAVPDFPLRAPLAARQTCRFSGAGRLQDFLDACDPFTLVELPPGELTEDVVLRKPVHLLGRGTVLRGVGKASVITVDCNEALLDSLTIEQAQTKAAGAVALGSGYTKIINCRISAPFISAVVAYGRSKVDIESCELFGSHNPCLYASDRAAVRCDSSLIHHAQTYGVMAEQAAAIYLIASHVYENGHSGVSVQSDGSLFVSGCDIFKNGSSGLQLTAVGFLHIANSKIRDHPAGAGLTAQGEIAVFVTKCAFERNSRNAIKALEAAAVRSVENTFVDSETNAMVLSFKNGLVSCQGDTFTGKTTAVLSCFDRGTIIANEIRIEKLAGMAGKCAKSGVLTVTNSFITGMTTYGFQLSEDAHVTFENTEITHARQSAVGAQGIVTGCLRNCKLSSNASCGLEAAHISGLEVIGCEFKGNSASGVSLIGKNQMKFTECVFAGNLICGAQVEGVGCDPTFDACQFIRNQTACTSCDSATPTFNGGTVSDSTEFGLSLMSGTATFNQVTIARCQNSGVSVSYTGRAIFQACTISEHGLYGVHAYDGGRARFEQCLFANHVQNVAAFACAKGKIQCRLCKFQSSRVRHCDVRENAIISLRDSELFQTADGTGIQVVDGGVLKLRGTHVHDEKTYGVYVDDQGICRAWGSAFYDCGVAGIALRGTGQAQLEGCHFLRCGQAGVMATGGVATLFNCVVRDNGEYGLASSAGGKLNETNSDFGNNRIADVMRQ